MEKNVRREFFFIFVYKREPQGVPPKIPTTMARNGFVVTVNNYTPADVLLAQGAVGQYGITYIVIGREVGESGTPHLQCYFQSSQRDFKRFAKVFPKGHMERAKGSDEQNFAYCTKEGDWQEFGERVECKAKGSGHRSDLDALQQAIRAGDDYAKICEEKFETAAKYGKFIKEQILMREQAASLTKLKEQYEGCALRSWQKELLQTLDRQDDRKITWIWESRGNVGKSWMKGYLQVVEGGLVLDSGKSADMAHIFSKVSATNKLVIFDLSRTLEKEGENGPDFLKGIYKIAENLKNGRLVTGKYDGASLVFESQKIIFFANFPPCPKAWSADRYDVYEI